MLLAPCPHEWLCVWCVFASPGRDSNLPQTSRLISIKLYTAGECVTPGEPPLFKLSLLEIGAAQISPYAMNLSQRAWPLAVLMWWMLRVFHPLPLLHHFFFFVSLFLSVEVCFWSVLISILISCQSPSAFVVLQQIRLGSYEVPLTGHWPQRVPPALCLSHYRMCEPLQLLLAQQHCFFTFICTNSSPR